MLWPALCWSPENGCVCPGRALWDRPRPDSTARQLHACPHPCHAVLHVSLQSGGAPCSWEFTRNGRFCSLSL